MCILGRYKSKHGDYFIDIQISAIKSLYLLLIPHLSSCATIQFVICISFTFIYLHKKLVEILGQQITFFCRQVQFVLFILFKMFLTGDIFRRRRKYAAHCPAPAPTWTTSWRMTSPRARCPPVIRCFPRPHPRHSPRPPRHSTPQMRISRQNPWTT